MDELLWTLAFAASFVPIWILWRAGRKANNLDFRIAQNDSLLLEEDGVIITQMTAVPAGTQITPNAHVVMAPESEPQR
ncbi:MAG: hypothetical protein L7U62_00435 [Candidatus Poseidoniaceae archaeon]|nr:hypothetical protein [Candidatus Poseidoniaceae archaeon]